MTESPIPEHQWQDFCEDFSRRHQGWLVGMRQLDTRLLEQGASPGHPPLQLYTGHRPLQEIREGRNRDLAEIMMTVGGGAAETSYLIEDVVALYNRHTDHHDQGLRIDSGDGTSTLMYFHTNAGAGEIPDAPRD